MDVSHLAWGSRSRLRERALATGTFLDIFSQLHIFTLINCVAQLLFGEGVVKNRVYAAWPLAAAGIRQPAPKIDPC